MLYANNKSTDQHAYPHSLISAFVIHCLESIIPVVAIGKIPRLLLASVAEHAGLSLTWSHNSKAKFSHDVAHINSVTKRSLSILTIVTKLSEGFCLY